MLSVPRKAPPGFAAGTMDQGAPRFRGFARKTVTSVLIGSFYRKTARAGRFERLR